MMWPRRRTFRRYNGRVVLFTVGHSNRSLHELVALLAAHGVERVADIRHFPRSRTNPQFDQDALAPALARAGLDYRHLVALGGRRRPRPGSTENAGWQHPAFRGYADYAGTPEFATALDELLRLAAERPTAAMCAEAPWWRCHRRIVADHALARGAEVRHILSAARADEAVLTPFAVQHEGGRLTYPAPGGACSER